MAMADTKPEIYSSIVTALLRKRLVARALVNTNYEGEVSNVGDSVRIMKPSAINVGTYSVGSDVTVQALAPTALTLSIDQQKYFAFDLDVVDETQSAIEMLQAGLSQGVYELADEIDAYVFAQYTEAGLDSYETGTNAWTLGTDGSGIPAFLGALVQKAEDNNIRAEELVLVAPPAFRNALTQHFGGTGDGVSSEVNVRGAMGETYMGVNVVISNNLTTASNVTHGLAFNLNDQGIALAEQINKVTVSERELQFATLVKGLAVYGAKVYDPAKVIDVNFSDNLLS